MFKTFEETQLLDTNRARLCCSVVSTYGKNGTIGILQDSNSMFEEIDSAYIKAPE